MNECFGKGDEYVSTTAWVMMVILVIGAVGGFFLARRYMVKYFEENPPINEEMLRSMMMQMGQKPSERKVKQIMASMKAQSTKKKK